MRNIGWVGASAALGGDSQDRSHTAGGARGAFANLLFLFVFVTDLFVCLFAALFNCRCRHLILKIDSAELAMFEGFWIPPHIFYSKKNAPCALYAKAIDDDKDVNEDDGELHDYVFAKNLRTSPWALPAPMLSMRLHIMIITIIITMIIIIIIIMIIILWWSLSLSWWKWWIIK